jgi:hypothetical protein
VLDVGVDDDVPASVACTLARLLRFEGNIGGLAERVFECVQIHGHTDLVRHELEEVSGTLCDGGGVAGSGHGELVGIDRCLEEGRPLNRPIVGMAPTPTGRGYWLVAADGGMFAFGDATFWGSSANLGSEVIGVAVRPLGDGYLLLGRDGGVFAFGAAQFAGRLQGEARSIAATGTGAGYWILGADGIVRNYGDATSVGTTPVSNSPVAIAR